MSANRSHGANMHEDQDDRDQRLLRRIDQGRMRGDALGRLRAEVATGELLEPYWGEVCRVVKWQLSSAGPDAADVEDVASTVIEYLVRKLEEATDFGSCTFRLCVFMKARSAAIDHWRADKRRRRHLSDFGGELPEVADAEYVALVHADVMTEIIQGLAARDQRILVERYVVGLEPQEIADRLGVSRGAVDAAYSRALAKLRTDSRVIAVRNRMAEAI